MIKKLLLWIGIDLRQKEWRLFSYCLLFYFFFFFVPNLKLFFALFFVLGVVFFSSVKNLKLTLWYLLIAALPFLHGKTQVYPLVTLLETADRFRYDFYFTIAPLDVITGLLLFLFLREKWVGKKKIKILKDNKISLILLLFLTMGFLSIFQAYFPEVSFLRFVKLTRSVTVFFLAFYFLTSKKARLTTVLLFLPTVILEGVLAAIQYGLKSPLGRFFELSLSAFPYGVTASETAFQFRSAGTRGHPNQLGALMAFLIPLVLSQVFIPSLIQKPLFISLTLILAMIGLVLSFARGAWLIGGFSACLLVWVLIRQKEFSLPKMVKKMIFIVIGPLFLLGIYFLLPRIVTLEEALIFRGSGTARLDLVREAINLTQLFPLGVGLGNFVPAMFFNQLTEVTEYFPTIVHNTFFIISSEMGILGLALFITFICYGGKMFFVRIRQYGRKKRESGFYWGVFVSFLTYILLSLVYPLFSFHFLDYFFIITALLCLM